MATRASPYAPAARRRIVPAARRTAREAQQRCHASVLIEDARCFARDFRHCSTLLERGAHDPLRVFRVILQPAEGEVELPNAPFLQSGASGSEPDGSGSLGRALLDSLFYTTQLQCVAKCGRSLASRFLEL
jgi:hypothetical protein